MCNTDGGRRRRFRIFASRGRARSIMHLRRCRRHLWLSLSTGDHVRHWCAFKLRFLLEVCDAVHAMVRAGSKPQWNRRPHAVVVHHGLVLLAQVAADHKLLRDVRTAHKAHVLEVKRSEHVGCSGRDFGPAALFWLWQRSRCHLGSLGQGSPRVRAGCCSWLRRFRRAPAPLCLPAECVPHPAPRAEPFAFGDAVERRLQAT